MWLLRWIPARLGAVDVLCKLCKIIHTLTFSSELPCTYKGQNSFMHLQINGVHSKNEPYRVTYELQSVTDAILDRRTTMRFSTLFTVNFRSIFLYYLCFLQ